MKQTSSISEIAKKAGVSKTAVSLVVNGKARAYRISPETIKKVEDVVKKTNFSPSQFARGFRLKQTRTIGLVVSDIANRFFSQIAKSVEKEARDKGYNLIIAGTQENPDIERHVIRNLLSKSVDGIVISSVWKRGESLQTVFEAGKPLVLFDRKIKNLKAYCITSDSYEGTRELAAHYLNRGCRHFAFIGGDPSTSTHEERLEGCRDALLAADIKLDDRKIRTGDYSPESGFAAAQSLFQMSGAEPEVIITASFTLLEGLLNYIRLAKKAVKSVPLIGTFDDHPLLDYLAFPVCSVEQNHALMGRKIFAMMEQAIKGQPSFKTEILKTKLIIRN